MLRIFLILAKQPKNIIAWTITSIFIFIILRIVPVYMILKNSFGIPGFTAVRKYELLYDLSLRSFIEIGISEQVLIVLLSLLTALNIVLFVIFAKHQQKILSGKSLTASISGMFLGLFGVGCLSCGVLILAPVITFLGLGAYSNIFIQYSVFLSYAGMILVIISILYLLMQLSKPLVCK